VSVVDMIRGAGAHSPIAVLRSSIRVLYVSRVAPDACPKGYGTDEKRIQKTDKC